MLVLFGDMSVGPVLWQVLHQARERLSVCQCPARHFHDRREEGAALDSGLIGQLPYLVPCVQMYCPPLTTPPDSIAMMIQILRELVCLGDPLVFCMLIDTGVFDVLCGLL